MKPINALMEVFARFESVLFEYPEMFCFKKSTFLLLGNKR